MPYNPANVVKDLLFVCSNCGFSIWVPPRRRGDEVTTPCTNCTLNTGQLWVETAWDEDEVYL